MPLLHRKPFTPNEFPADLRESEEVFFCTSTREIFRDYDEFCERIILCNSLVWSCALTGRSHLTYQEAVASEQKVKKLLKRFPMELRIPVLYLASLCERKSLIDLAEDVFTYVKDRYFIGETVQVNFDEKTSTSCHVLAVIPPTSEELQGIKQHHYKNGERQYWPPADTYKYEVERLDDNREETVLAEQVSRSKSAYNKDKNRLYIKQFVHLEGGYWRLKEASYMKYGISRVKYSQIFCGEPPVMVPKQNSPMRRKNLEKGKRQETINKYFKQQSPSKHSNNLTQKRSYTRRNDITKNKQNGKIEKTRRKRRSKKEMEEARQFRPGTKEFMEAKARAKANKKEEKMKLAEFVREWNRKREDLECEDLKELPMPNQIKCRVPNLYFGDVVMMMEFMNSFRKVLPVKDFFPNGITFELLERALVENEVAGPFCDILQLLLATVFDLLEQEVEEQKETDVRITPYQVFEHGDETTMDILKKATAAEAWVRQHHAAPLSQLTLETSTITEILRLHLLSSGSRPKDKCRKWRYQARGGYCSNDDPGVILKLKQPHIIQHLSQSSVCDFPIGDKVTILNCLVNQILTYSTVRDIIDEGCDKARQCRVELRALNAAETRREKEEAMRQKELKQKGEEPPAEDPSSETIQRETRSNSTTDSKKDQQRLQAQIAQALAGAQLSPLGTDRAYRRFWIFTSLPGLFVEHQEENPGPCLPKGTPMFNGMVNEDSYAYVRRLFEEGANKENFSQERLQKYHMNSPSKKLLSEKNGAESPIFRGISFKNDEMSLEPHTCWGDPTICPVHGEAARHVTWAFYNEESDVNRLIESLNRRGIRERRLRLALIEAKDHIIKNLPLCPVDKLNPTMVDKNIDLRPKTRVMKQYENANLNFPPGTSSEKILESTLRDLILETEEKVNAGIIGVLKVKDRIVWREALANDSYDKQCKKLTWGGKFVELNSDENEEAEDSEKKDGDSLSRSSTPSIDLMHQGHIGTDESEPVAQRPAVLDLASAILQIEQSVDQKFMKRPLGLDPKERERGERMPTPALERWEAALMEATTFPQLFLHLSTLENSVEWNKSALNAYCRLCKRKTDPENMLLCDTCNKGHHLYCLKPKLTKVPPGDWHCPRCKPKEKVMPVKKKRHFFSDDSDEEEEDEEQKEMICKVCNENGAQLSCDSCEVKFHLTCVNPPLRKMPKSKWICHECRVQNSLAQQAKIEANKLNSSELKEEKEKLSPEPKQVKAGPKETKKPESRKTEAKEPRKMESEKPRKTETEKPRKTESDKPRESRRSETRKVEFKKDQETERDWRGWAGERVSFSPPSNGEVERASRRRCSRAATAKISLFAKQLRSNSWDADDDKSSEHKPELRESSRRRSRRSYETGGENGELPLDNAALQEILEEIMHHKDAWPFLRPVTKAEVPDYHTIIKRPMDFGTIKHKLNMLQYSRNSEVFADAELLFNNCYMYNEEGSEVYKLGERLEKLFEKLCRERNLSYDKEEDSPEPPPPSKRSRPVL